MFYCGRTALLEVGPVPRLKHLHSDDVDLVDVIDISCDTLNYIGLHCMAKWDMAYCSQFHVCSGHKMTIGLLVA